MKKSPQKKSTSCNSNKDTNIFNFFPWVEDIQAHPKNNFEYIDPITGYKCEIKRHPQLLAYIATVYVPTKHPFYKIGDDYEWDDIQTEIFHLKDGNFTIDFMHYGDFVPGSHRHDIRDRYGTFEEVLSVLSR